MANKKKYNDCRDNIPEEIQHKIKEFDSIDKKQWEEICESYEFEDIENILNEPILKNELKLVLEAMIYGICDDFYNADKNYHQALKKILKIKSKKEAKRGYIAITKAYVHFLFGYQRFFHAENVLKHEIRSDEFNLRGQKRFLEFYFLLGLALLKQKKYFEAKDAFLIYKDSLIGSKRKKGNDQAIIDIHLSKAHRYLASTYYGLGTELWINKAKKEFELSKTTDPKSFHAAISANNLSNILFNEFQKSLQYPILVEAIREINDGLEIFGNLDKSKVRDFEYYQSVLFDTRALVKMGYQDLEGAEEDLKSALNLQETKGIPPTAVKFHYGYLYEQKGKLGSAKTSYQEAINTGGNKKAQTRYLSKAYVAKGLLAQKEKKIDEARKCFQYATDFDPSNKEAKLYLQNIQVSKSKTLDWWGWWSESDSKKAVLVGIIGLAVILWFVPYFANDNITEQEENWGSSGNYTNKITRKFTPPEANLGIIGVLIVIILLPSVSKIKAGMIEVETKEMKPTEEGNVVQGPLSL